MLRNCIITYGHVRKFYFRNGTTNVWKVLHSFPADFKTLYTFKHRLNIGDTF